jgi:hypothetical protein
MKELPDKATNAHKWRLKLLQHPHVMTILVPKTPMKLKQKTPKEHMWTLPGVAGDAVTCLVVTRSGPEKIIDAVRCCLQKPRRFRTFSRDHSMHAKVACTERWQVCQGICPLLDSEGGI